MQQTDLSKARARHLRKEMTPAERALWSALRNRRFLGLKIRRQVPIGPFIADFYCADRRLVIEADGSGRGCSRESDFDHWLGQRGFGILRLASRDILNDLPACLDAIAAHTPPH